VKKKKMRGVPHPFLVDPCVEKRPARDDDGVCHDGIPWVQSSEHASSYDHGKATYGSDRLCAYRRASLFWHLIDFILYKSLQAGITDLDCNRGCVAVV
jgi:hypothetical protein